MTRPTIVHLSRWSVPRCKEDIARRNWRVDHNSYIYIGAPLHFSGPHGCGDEINAPVSVVIDVGQAFVIVDRRIHMAGGGGGYMDELTAPQLFRAAKSQWSGFTLLWDERDEEKEDEGAHHEHETQAQAD